MTDFPVTVTAVNADGVVATKNAVITTTAVTTAWPNASTTGVPAGTVLTPSGSITSSAAGQIIEGKNVTGYIEIRHPNVTVRKCKIIGNTFVGIFTNSSTGTIIEDTEIDMKAYSATGKGNKAINLDGDRAIIRRCNIHDAEDGIYFGCRNVLIEDNYIHDLPSTGTFHTDGIQLFADQCSEVTVRHNALLLAANTSSVFTCGAVQNLTIENNRMLGGAATLRVRGENGVTVTSGVRIINNRLGNWTYFPLDLVNAGNVFLSGNVNDATGAPIS